MNSIELSFCIPTYNRAQVVYRLVTDILLCQDPNIEIVVLDNGSTDNTLSILNTIKDKRLFVHSNGENKGALFNMVNVLDKARGRFVVYSTDQDHVDSTKITQFKEFLLSQSDLAAGFCTFNSSSKISYETYEKGYLAVNKIAYQCNHPTGHYFNNDMLKSLNIVERFSDYEFVDLFPIEFIFAELCLLGNGTIYHERIFTPETSKGIAKNKSSTTNGSSKKAFFSPESRLKMAVNFISHIADLNVSKKEKKIIMSNVFLRQLISATITYRQILRNEVLCEHYYIKSKKISFFEVFFIGVSFYKSYLKEINRLYPGKDLNFSYDFIYGVVKKFSFYCKKRANMS